MSITNFNCMKINTAQIVKRLFIRFIFFDVLPVFCNHQPHTRSKPIDGVIDYRLGQCFPLFKNGFFRFYGIFKSSSAVNISLQSAPNAVIDWIKIWTVRRPPVWLQRMERRLCVLIFAMFFLII